MLRFLVFLACFYAMTATPWFHHSFMPAYLDWSARVGSRSLRLLGEQTQVVDTSIVSPRFGLSIQRGCDGIDPAALFVAGVLAFRARWLNRLIGVLVGVMVLLMLNGLRIISLYYAGARKPELFTFLHIDIWQPLFVVFAALIFITWAKRQSIIEDARS